MANSVDPDQKPTDMALHCLQRQDTSGLKLFCYIVYVRTCIYHIRNQSLTNVTVYFQVYMQVYLYIYIHIYIQFARNFDTLYATNLKFGMIFTQTKTLVFMVELPLDGTRGQSV